MAAVTVATVRSGFAARISALSGWWEAPVPEPLFGPSQVPDAVPAAKAHLAFAVGVPATPRFEGRQRPDTEATAITNVRVRFLARHKPGPTVSQESLATALNAEHDLIKQIIAQSASWPTYPVGIESVTRSLNPSGEWYLHELLFIARHPFALQ